AREPFTDVIVDEKNSEVIVTAEIPGVAKEDIRINAAEDSIEIRAETRDKKYHKNLPLAVEINPNSTNAKYNNGILEIKARLQKASLLRKGVDIKIE
ncbi:MAG: Hsp20/alpha crystallin family protein, partial [Methanobacteriota archaeon]